MTLHNDLSLGKPIKLLILDVDGILADNGLYFGPQGEHLKRFHTHDGLGIKLLQKNGIPVAVITARVSEIVAQRAKELGILHLYQGNETKLDAFHALLEKTHIAREHCAYMGDDLPDMPVMQQVGLRITTPNAVDSVRAIADWITLRAGGYGAVREAAEYLLRAQNKLDAAIADYLKTHGHAAP